MIDKARNTGHRLLDISRLGDTFKVVTTFGTYTLKVVDPSDTSERCLAGLEDLLKHEPVKP